MIQADTKKLDKDYQYNLSLFYHNLVSNLSPEELRLIKRTDVVVREDECMRSKSLLFALYLDYDYPFGICFPLPDFNSWTEDIQRLKMMQEDLKLCINMSKDINLRSQLQCSEIGPYQIGEELTVRYSIHNFYNVL